MYILFEKNKLMFLSSTGITCSIYVFEKWYIYSCSCTVPCQVPFMHYFYVYKSSETFNKCNFFSSTPLRKCLDG